MTLRTAFTHIQPIRQLERYLVLEAARKPGALSPGHLELVRYALNLARATELRERGVDHDLFDTVAPFRHWLTEQLGWFADPDTSKHVDWRGVERLVPAIAARVGDVRTHLLARHVNDFSAERLEREITRKELVLVLGGGGGSGYCHLGAFALLAEMGITPGMIVGSSMGAMLGLFRAESKVYDPTATALALPRPSEFGKAFTPYRGHSRFGFPGTIELRARRVGTEIFKTLVGRDVPTIRELAIPYRPIVTGLRSGMGFAISDVERQIAKAGAQRSPLATQRRAQLFFGVVRTMLENPRFLTELVFGSEPGTEDFSTVDAMGFSVAVPGVIHYDLFTEHDPSARVMQTLFDRHQLFRVTDGGIVSNVACKAAWECVQRGEIETRNAFILGFDAFAPVLNLNAMFMPVQQLVRRNVAYNKPYSDHLIAYRQPPSPVKLLRTFEVLQQVIARTRAQLEAERPFIEAMMRPIPRWAVLENRAVGPA